MEKLTYRVETFEGPLDLLLSLVAKNKLDICKIRITDLVSQYLEQIERMRSRDMDVASEFLEMAARLVYIKTVSLLPKPEEADKLTRELSGQLMEYRACRQAAALLSEHISPDAFTRAPEPFTSEESYRGHIDPQEILEALRSAVGRGKRFLPPSPKAFSGIVAHRIVSVTSRIIHVLKRLRTSGTAKYADLFSGCSGRSELVATFLAVLELIKGGRIRLEGRGDETVELLERR